jgi:hypothetical protein
VLSIMQARARLFGLDIETQGTPPAVAQKAFICIDLDLL